MTIPKAVSPDNKVPGLYLVVDLNAGVASPGTGLNRVVIIAPKSSAGDLAANEVRTLAGDVSAATAFGPGTPGHLCAKAVYAKKAEAQIDAIAPTAGAGTATYSATLAGAPASNNVLDVDVHGVTWEVAWLVGETAADVATKLIDSILERTNDLAATAATGGAGVAAISSKVTGKIGNDIKVRIALRSGTTGTETIGGGTSVNVNLSGGTTDPDITTVLTYLAGREYHYIVPCLSNADVANVVSANNCKKTVTHIGTYNTGRSAKLQQFIVAHTGALADAIATTPHTNSCANKEYGQLVQCISGRGLPAQLAGRECGGRLAAISIDPAANRIGEIMDGYVGALDTIGDNPTDPELQSAITGGVSILAYTAQGSELMVRPITTHSQDDVGGPDLRCLDVQNVDGTYIVARDIRDNLPLAFPNAKIQADTPPGGDPPPRGVIEERDVKAWVISRLWDWVDSGVVQGAALSEVVADGTLYCQLDPADETQLNLVLPYKIVQPLAKFGVVAQRLAS